MPKPPILKFLVGHTSDGKHVDVLGALVCSTGRFTPAQIMDLWNPATCAQHVRDVTTLPWDRLIRLLELNDQHRWLALRDELLGLDLYTSVAPYAIKDEEELKC